MIEELLREHGVHPNTEMDQHFLDSEDIILKEVEEAEISSEDTVLEIGGGVGNLTEKLAESAGKVLTVEKDSKLVKVLRERFRDTENVEVIEGDFLELKDDLEYDRCVSNPPYNLSSEIVEELGKKEVMSVLLLQKDFVDKLIAKPGSDSYSFFTVMTNFYFIPVFLKEVSRSSFIPEPEVDSALVKLFPRKKGFRVERETFERTARALFTHRRKKVRNAMVDSRHILEMEKKRLKEIRDKIPYSGERVVNLDVRKVAEIAEFLEEKR